MNFMDCQTENGLRVICAGWPEGDATSSRHIASIGIGNHEERIDRLSEGSISLGKRITRLEGQDNAAHVEMANQEASMPFDERAEDKMVDQILALGNSDPLIKRKAIGKIEAEGMTREEAREDLLEDALVDRILKRGGKQS
ncbi:MAG: hypothetical protein GX654_05945 [Desulfatiglans sp.]|nr:hypothetical protein [Desulfatiglans sp.]